MRRSEFFTVKEIEALFSVIRSPRDRAIFRVVSGRGLRGCEVGQLQFSDWNDQDGVLRVRRAKNSISMTYRLPPAEAAALRAWLRIRGRAPGPLFPSQKPRAGGLGINRSQIFRLLQKYCSAAAIAPEKAHTFSLRHACGVQIRAAGGSVDAIRERLGHRAPQSALKYVRRLR